MDEAQLLIVTEEIWGNDDGGRDMDWRLPMIMLVEEMRDNGDDVK